MVSYDDRESLYTNLHMKTENNIYMVGTPQEYSEALLKRVSEGLKVASTTLKYEKPIDVAIIDAESWDIPAKMSILAHARINHIEAKICFYREDIQIDTVINVELPLTIQHEFSHVVRANTVGYPETLLDACIDEGIACFVEYGAMPERSIPYIQEIPGEMELLQKARTQFSQRLTSKLHSDWFYGTGEMPNWTGYRLGFLIVQKYMSANKISLDHLVRLDSKTVLA